MKTKPTIQFLTALAAFALVASGCSSTANTKQETPSPAVRSVHFNDLPGWQGEAPRSGDMDQGVRFALTIAEAGRHEEAATLFEELARQARSERHAFEHALLLAAANERLKAGQPGLATRNIEAYLDRADNWQVASLKRDDRMLLALREVVRDLERTPSTRNLLRSLNTF